MRLHAASPSIFYRTSQDANETAARRGITRRWLPRPALRGARTCYDHIAGAVGVAIHDAFLARGWLSRDGSEYVVTERGKQELERLGIDIAAVQAARRRIA